MELAAAAAAKSPSAWDQPGTLGFLVVFGMAIVLYFVFRSLARHLRKINEAARLEVAQAEAVQTAAVLGGGAQLDGVQPGGIPADAVQNPSVRGSLGQRPQA
jgi:hypothetical protein